MIEERELHAGTYTYKNVNGEYVRNDAMDVYTSDYSYMSKFDRFCEEHPDNWKCVGVDKVGGDIVGKRYSCTWDCVFFRAKPMRGRPRTEEEKQAFKERMAKLREEGR